MIGPGTEVEMIKGYKGVRGVIREKTDSPYGFYVVTLDNGINIVVGQSSFKEYGNTSGDNTYPNELK